MITEEVATSRETRARYDQTTQYSVHGGLPHFKNQVYLHFKIQFYLQSVARGALFQIASVNVKVI